MAAGCHLEKRIWRYNFANDSLITTTFGNQMQNDMLVTMHTSKSKPEIECQYGCRPFSETGSSFISAVDWDISSKFGIQIDFHLLKQIPSLNPDSEVDFRISKPEIEFQYGCRPFSETGSSFISAVDWDISSKFGRQIDLHILTPPPGRFHPRIFGTEKYTTVCVYDFS